MFRFYNANPHGRYVDDCVTRGYSIAENISWDEAYKELSNAAREKGMMMDSVEFVDEYFDELYERFCPEGATVEEFIEENPQGVYLLSMPGHITVVKEGINFDTFSTLDRSIWCAWKVF